MDRAVRVLLVEDNLINQKVIERLVTREHDVELKTADSGEEALSLLRVEPFDLILMDIQLEGIDGIEGVRRIRALGEAPTASDVTVAVLSGYADSRQVEAAMEAGADRYILKPVNAEEIGELIEAVRSASV